VDALKRLALPCVSHFSEIALTGPRRLRSLLAACPFGARGCHRSQNSTSATPRDYESRWPTNGRKSMTRSAGCSIMWCLVQQSIQFIHTCSSLPTRHAMCAIPTSGSLASSFVSVKYCVENNVKQPICVTKTVTTSANRHSVLLDLLHSR
jgi:hypothetical protein